MKKKPEKLELCGTTRDSTLSIEINDAVGKRFVIEITENTGLRSEKFAYVILTPDEANKLRNWLNSSI